MPDLAVELAAKGKRGLRLANPVMTASGTFSYGLEYARHWDIERLGAIVSKAITLLPRAGNRQPRLVEAPAGLINSIGLQNIGVEALVRDIAPIWATWRLPVVVNIAGESVDDYARLAQRLDEAPGVSGLELNVSCPNVVSGLEFGSDPKAAAAVTAAVVSRTTLPVIVKLSPSAADVAAVARAVVKEGADAICLTNTMPAMAFDVSARRPALGWGSGGLSGPALRPIALRLVAQAADVVDVPIIGCGGIATAEHALEFMMAGASAVQVGTATFVNPRAPLDILEGLEEFCRSEGIEDVRALSGAVRRERASLARAGGSPEALDHERRSGT